MTMFDNFKVGLQRMVRALGARRGRAHQDLEALIERADNWEALEQRLIELRTQGRKRQQEVLDRLAPLAGRVEALLAQARQARIKVVQQNLLRQADSYLRELEGEDEAAKVLSANDVLITRILQHVQRARAMGERGVDAEALDTLAAHLEEIVERHAAAYQVADDLGSTGALPAPTRVTPAAVAQRLSSIQGQTEGEQAGADPAVDIEKMQSRLYTELA